MITVASATLLDALNPLRRIPVLVLDEGQAVFDSRVICKHLASLAPERALMPADVAVATRWSLSGGVAPPRAWSACSRASGAQPPPRPLSARATALEHIDFRYPHPWHEMAPASRTG